MEKQKQVSAGITNNRNKAESAHQSMFRLAAFFNFAVAILLGLFQENILPWLGMEPLVNEVFLHLFLGLVFIFGIGYYCISLDAEKNRSIIWLGFWAKSLVVLLLLIHALQGNIPWRLASLGLVDLWYAVQFMRFLLTCQHHL